MAKALDYTWELPYSPQSMFEQGIRQDYIQAQAKTIGHYDLNLVSLADGPEGGRAYATYDIEIDLPNWAKKMFPARAKVTEIRTWAPAAEDGSRAYDFTVKIEQVPAEIKGTVELKAAPGGTTTNTVRAQIRASIPVIGGKLEEMVAKELATTIEGERDFIINWMRTVA
jgi:Protein of unknown function (DUF2505)